MKKILSVVFAVLLISACHYKAVEVIEETYENGNPKTVKYYKDEAKEILIKEILYYEDGTKKLEGSYKNGERTGEWSYWYPNGNLWSRGSYKAGIDNGLKTVWHENGQKYYEGDLKDGKRIGVWKFWEKDGSLIKEINYDEK
jgi:antitoxin component YwqK of YwqJK toxin-antitoxin module